MAYTDFEKELIKLKIQAMIEKGNLGEENLEETMFQVTQMSEAQVRSVLDNFKPQYRAKLVATKDRLAVSAVSVQTRIDNLDAGELPI